MVDERDLLGRGLPFVVDTFLNFDDFDLIDQIIRTKYVRRTAFRFYYTVNLGSYSRPQQKTLGPAPLEKHFWGQEVQVLGPSRNP